MESEAAAFSAGREAMELREFYYLIVLAEEQSISRAAERLSVSQSSLSQFLKQFEKRMGAPVFIRTKKGVQPTAAGQILISRIQQIIRASQRAQQEFHDGESAGKGSVFFGISPLRGQHILPPILKKFYETHSDIRVNIREDGNFALQQKICEGTLDLALSVCQAVSIEGICLEYLYKDEVVLVTPRSHPLMEHMHTAEDGHMWVSLEEVSQHECIISDEDTTLGHLVRNTMGALDLPLFCRHDNMTAAFAVSMACQGLGLAFMYRSLCEEREDVVYLSLGEQRIYIRLALLLPETEHHSRAVLAFAQMLRQELQEEASD